MGLIPARQVRSMRAACTAAACIAAHTFPVKTLLHRMRLGARSAETLRIRGSAVDWGIGTRFRSLSRSGPHHYWAHDTHSGTSTPLNRRSLPLSSCAPIAPDSHPAPCAMHAAPCAMQAPALRRQLHGRGDPNLAVEGPVASQWVIQRRRACRRRRERAAEKQRSSSRDALG